MELSSWPVHFRNRYIIRRDWRTIPRSGTIGWAGLAGFLLGLSTKDGRLQESTMQLFHQLRRWRRFGLCVVLCLLAGRLALAQTDPSTPPPKPAQTSATPAPKAKPNPNPPNATGHTTTKHSPAHKSTAHTSARKSKTARGKAVAKKRGQQAIDSDRARQIQTALIREHYMQGEPSGTWDNATQAAMQRYQAAQGWQSKTTPDARALIKLGLGPSSDHLLNPESAMTSSPAAGGPKATTKPLPPENNIPQQ
jgi:hypothetical protein